jgi:hypothetical protein
VGRATAEKAIGQMINEVTDRCNVVKYICKYKLHGKRYFLEKLLFAQLLKKVKKCLTFTEPCIMIYFYSKTNEMHQSRKFILFCSSILHVWDGLSVHHQETKTVYTGSGTCSISFPPASSQQNLFDICMYSLRLLMMDGKTL